jgi:alkylation response protein AidB-like acyl-CoA dehydrogenase
MAAAAFAARTAAQDRALAQTSYDMAYQYAERRHQPPGGGDVNQRQLEAALIKAEVKWTGLETAHFNYMNEGTFADEQEKTSEKNSWFDKEAAL